MCLLTVGGTVPWLASWTVHMSKGSWAATCIHRSLLLTVDACNPGFKLLLADPLKRWHISSTRETEETLPR